MSEDTDNTPQPITDEMSAFTDGLCKHIGQQINAFVEARGIDKEKTPLQATLMALGALVSQAVIQQPEHARPIWLHYFINGVTTGTGVSFLIAHMTPEIEAKMAGSPGKEKSN
jgi:hypothetical protein